MLICPTLSKVAVLMSTTPAVRRPYCAGSAPVIRLKLPMKLVVEELTEGAESNT